MIRQILGSWGPPGEGRLVKPSMRCEASRQLSFRKWPGSTHICPRELARAGFFYLGRGDQVQCFCCGGVLMSWEPGDRPLTEHHKFFPHCPFLLGTEVGNIPQGMDSVDGQILGQLQQLSEDEEGQEEPWQEAVYTQLRQERARLATFRDWPQDAPVNPDQLVEAGFFYTGLRDVVRCFHCDGGLRYWQRGEDPWMEHAKYFPRCGFLIQAKGRDFIRRIQDSLLNSPESMPESRSSSDHSPALSTGSPGDWQCLLQSRIAQDALQMGFSQNKVASLLQSRVLLTGAPYSSLSDLVTDLVEEDMAAECTEPFGIPEAPVRRESSEPQRLVDPEPPLSTEEQLRRLKEERQCKVCMDKDVSMVFVPCGHLVVCTDCAPNLRHCPICRAAIRGSVRAFMS